MLDLAVSCSPAVDASVERLVEAVPRELESRGYPMERKRAAGERGRLVPALTRDFGM